MLLVIFGIAIKKINFAVLIDDLLQSHVVISRNERMREFSLVYAHYRTLIL